MKVFLVPGVLLLFLSWTAWSLDPRSVVVTVVDQELETPLEGVRLQVVGTPGIVMTSANGQATLVIPADTQRALVVAQLPGYATAKVAIGAGETQAKMALVLSGVVEGQELVVERSAPQKSEAQPGVSQALTQQDVRQTGKIGLIEDALHSVKTLPGVGYSSYLGGRPSVRGGSPDETLATLDGAYVLYPYHWGGAFSIFNPDMVDSVKLSSGVISARYGQSLSALLEVQSINPDRDQARWVWNLSTLGTDAFFQTPLGDHAALLMGGKVMTMEYALQAAGGLGVFSQAPYIREGFAKWTWEPSTTLKTFVNAYWGVDGVGISNRSTNKDIVTDQKFSYTNSEALVTSGTKVLVDDHNLFSVLVSLNAFDQDLTGRTVANGTKAYDQDFLTRYQAELGGATSFTLHDLTTDIHTRTTNYLLQGKIDWDWEAAPGQIWTFGQESLLAFWSKTTFFDGWQTFQSPAAGPEFDHIVINTKADGNKTYTQGIYGLSSFTLVPDTLTGEGGVRIDDSLVFNDEMTLQTQPAVNPRLLLTYVAARDVSFVRSLSLMGGTGLSSQFPTDNPYIDKKYGVTDFSIGPERAWFSELGTEVVTVDDWKIDLMGYWKSYWGRFYSTLDGKTSTYALHSDGIGNAYGFDVFFQKRTRTWESSLAYSFIVSRLYNPGPSGTTAANGDPLGTWFYPSYQRFHTISLVATFRHSDSFSITTEAQAASGTPLARVGATTSYPAQMGSQVVEIFSRTSTYDDNLRIGWAYPVSVKFSWHDFYPQSKIRWEAYLGIQDIFAMLYTKGIQGNPPLDMWYGDSLSGPSGASFGSGIPIPSVGFTMGY